MQTAAAETKTPGWFTDEEKAEHARAYSRMLVERYRAGEPMPLADAREARRLICAATAFEKQRKATA